MSYVMDELYYQKMVEHAKTTYEECGEHAPMMLAFARGEIHAIHLEHLIRDEIPRPLVYALLRHLLQLIGADSYMLVTEAWRAVARIGDSEMLRASRCPDREEILQVIGIFPDGRRVCTMMRIADGKVIEAPERMDSGLEGGMTDLLKGNMADPETERVAYELAQKFRDQIRMN